MGIAPAALQETTRRIVELAAPAYLMAVAGNSDPMLGYLTTSFREHPQLRRRSGRHITSAMRKQLAALDAVPPDGEVPHPRAGAQATAALYAVYVKEGGDRRTTDALREKAQSRSTACERADSTSVWTRRGARGAAGRACPHGDDLRPGTACALRRAGRRRRAGGVPASHSRSDRLTRPRGISRTPTLRRIDSR